jgi:16S rRNA (guanine966-N2)-methyltransferase
VREAVFAMLGEIGGARVLDLFAGSGGLGIEALSRGAAEAVFIERDALALRTLRENLASLGLDAPRVRATRADALAALRSARRRQETYDLIFIDPPYAQARDWGPELSAALAPVLARAARVIVESDRRAPLQLQMQVERERRYGDTTITIHSRQ